MHDKTDGRLQIQVVTMPPKKPIFEMLDGISFSKKFLLCPENTKEYSKYVINGFLSQHADSILLVQEMNIRPGIPDTMHYLFLMYSLRSRRRLSGFPKKAKADAVLKAVASYYGISCREASHIAGLHTPEQTKTIVDLISAFQK